MSCESQVPVTSGSANAAPGAPNEHADMLRFWEQHSAKATMSSMFLDEEPFAYADEDTAEVLATLPDFAGGTVVELGAGIGRFTQKLAPLAGSLKAVDAMASFTERNREANGHFSNVEFVCADAAAVDFPPASVDLVFTNWLLMYLSDEESYGLMRKALVWLREGGHLFVRESCFHSASGVEAQKKRAFNPTIYRTPLFYSGVLQSLSVPADDGAQAFHFEVLSQRSIQTYIKHKQNPNQVCWLARKVRVDAERSLEHQGRLSRQNLQLTLDTLQYSTARLRQYEFIYGATHTGTGGDAVARAVGRELELRPNQRALEIASGLGGSAFLIAQEYGVEVLGLDISCNMVGLALEKLHDLNIPNVQFQVGDAVTVNLPAASFDAIYSRDSILHIPFEQRVALFQNCFRMLKPGGRLLVLDYCCADPDELPTDLREYYMSRGYYVTSIAHYCNQLKSTGFTDVQTQDRTALFVEKTDEELQTFIARKDEFLKTFGQESAAEYEAFVSRWRFKLEHCAATNGTGGGAFVWGWFCARKPRAV